MVTEGSSVVAGGGNCSEINVNKQEGKSASTWERFTWEGRKSHRQYCWEGGKPPENWSKGCSPECSRATATDSSRLILWTFWFGLFHSNFSLARLCCPPHLLSQIIFYFPLARHMTDICYVVRLIPAVSCDNLLISQSQVIFMERLISSMSWTLGSLSKLLPFPFWLMSLSICSTGAAPDLSTCSFPALWFFSSAPGRFVWAWNKVLCMCVCVENFIAENRTKSWNNSWERITFLWTALVWYLYSRFISHAFMYQNSYCLLGYFNRKWHQQNYDVTVEQGFSHCIRYIWKQNCWGEMWANNFCSCFSCILFHSFNSYFRYGLFF